MEEGFIEGLDHDVLVDDPDRIEGYRAVGLVDGVYQRFSGRTTESLTYLVKSGRACELRGWFAERAIELLADRKITVSRELLPQPVRDEGDRQQTSAAP